MAKQLDNKYHIQFEVDGIEDFVNFTTKRLNAPSDTTVLYRGQLQYFRLIPMIGRFEASNLPIEKIEKTIFAEFKRIAASLIPPQTDDWHLLALARHRGLPTRLLDWTENPLAALYFATRVEPEVGRFMSVWRFCAKPSEMLYDEDGTNRDRYPECDVFRAERLRCSSRETLTAALPANRGG